MDKKILIAEDTPQWQAFQIELLNQHYKDKIHCTICNCAKEAVEILRTNKDFDLIVTDLQMETDFHPDFAGEWLIKQLQNTTPYNNNQIVIVSATYNIGFIAHRLGVDYLSKRVLINYPEAYISLIGEKLKLNNN